MTNQRIDLNALSELKEMLEDEFDDLVETYIRDTESKLASITEEMEQHNVIEVRKLAHSMKGASVNLGINHLGEICHQLETDAAAEDESAFASHLQKLASEVVWVVSELKQMSN